MRVLLPSVPGRNLGQGRETFPPTWAKTSSKLPGQPLAIGLDLTASLDFCRIKNSALAGSPQNPSSFSLLPPFFLPHQTERRRPVRLAGEGDGAAPPPAPSPARALTRVGARRWCPEPAHAWRGRALSSAVAPVHPWHRRWCASRLGVATCAARAGGGVGGCVPPPFSFARVWL